MTSQSHYKMCLWDDGQFFYPLGKHVTSENELFSYTDWSSNFIFWSSIPNICRHLLLFHSDDFFFWNYWTFFPRFFMNLAFLFLASVDCYGGCWILPALLVFSTSFTINVVATENSITDLIILVVLISLSLHQVGM